MDDNPLDRIPSYDRVSIRAVVVDDDEDPGQALSEAGIVDPIALPVVFGEDPPDRSFGDGFTPNVTAVLEPDQEEDDDFDDAPQRGKDTPQQRGSVRQTRPTAASLPAAYGMQPLAPVRPRGG